MATKLFLRSSQNNGIGATYFDMLTTAGSGTATGVVNTAASGTEIQWTQTAGGAALQFISGRVPAGGFTLTSTDISIWAQESNGTANCGGRYRVFKRASSGTETELGGGPFNDGVEFGTSAAEMLWTGNVTDTAFAEDDRILLKVYITNVGTMGSGRTCTLTYNGADAATGDSFLNLAETVSFKAETTTHDATGALTGQLGSVAGSAAHVAVHASTGAIAGPGTGVAGSASRTRAHASSGSITGPGSVISGASARFRAHPSSGALTGPSSTLGGASARLRTFGSSGALIGQLGSIAGSAARFRAFGSSGDLAGAGSLIDGISARADAATAVTHDSSGILVGADSIITGRAELRQHTAIALVRRRRARVQDYGMIHRR